MNPVYIDLLNFFSLAVMELQKSGSGDSVRRVLGNLERRLSAVPRDTEGLESVMRTVLGLWVMYWESKEDWEKVVETCRRALSYEEITKGWDTPIIGMADALVRLDRNEEALLILIDGLTDLSEANAHRHDIADCLLRVGRLLELGVSEEITNRATNSIRKAVEQMELPDVDSGNAVDGEHVSTWMQNLAFSLNSQLQGGKIDKEFLR